MMPRFTAHFRASCRRTAVPKSYGEFTKTERKKIRTVLQHVSAFEHCGEEIDPLFGKERQCVQISFPQYETDCIFDVESKHSNKATNGLKSVLKKKQGTSINALQAPTRGQRHPGLTFPTEYRRAAWPVHSAEGITFSRQSIIPDPRPWHWLRARQNAGRDDMGTRMAKPL
ncbi:hypothetical protein B0F90DRAFT_869316 [Multifurca ochricompacta]|uniref:Uncharacterized protein n=1 Tax=Multifurca ochricompacta TaxID=376703 RepID=A0AAD4QLZ7_9AGAM|nr:hypothetical protein B0F90DRAFT_869316 [Multifurca ochricompacta]